MINFKVKIKFFYINIIYGTQNNIINKFKKKIGKAPNCMLLYNNIVFEVNKDADINLMISDRKIEIIII